MAHQVAHILEGDCLEPPRYMNRDFRPLHLFTLFVLLTITAGAVVFPLWYRIWLSEAMAIGIGLAILSIAFFVFSSVLLSRAQLPGRRAGRFSGGEDDQGSRCHDRSAQRDRRPGEQARHHLSVQCALDQVHVRQPTAGHQKAGRRHRRRTGGG